MKNSQKMGGIAALYAGLAYVVGMVGFLLVVDTSSVADPMQRVALMADNQAFLSILHLIVYVVWGIFLVALTVALYEQLKVGAPAIAKIAAVIGFIWAGLIIASGTLFNVGMGTVIDLYGRDPAQAATVWVGIESVFEGLSGVEIVGGTWMLLVSWAALQAAELPKMLNYLGLLIGVAGFLSVVPALIDVAVIVFGLGQIVWFVWLGIVMLRSRSNATERQPETLVPQH